MIRIAAFALWLLAAPLSALAQLAQLCPADARTAGRATLHNEDKRTLAQIFNLTGDGAAVEFASPDWTGRRDALQARIEEVLRARPRVLAPQIVWAEGADLRTDTFSAALRRLDGAAARLAVSGYQVCVRDASSEQWFFRNVPADLWSD